MLYPEKGSGPIIMKSPITDTFTFFKESYSETESQSTNTNI